MSWLAPIQEDLCAEEYPDRKDRKPISNASVLDTGYMLLDGIAGNRGAECLGAAPRPETALTPFTLYYLVL